MKIIRTLDGGLRIDAHDPEDWQLLLGIPRDATACDRKLARRLGDLITDEAIAEDWQELIVPELDEAFDSDLNHVATTISAARMEAADGPGPLFITRDESMQWYGTLNQARLALEEVHRFGPSDHLAVHDVPPPSRPAFLRSRFYCALQSLLLEQIMR